MTELRDVVGDVEDEQEQRLRHVHEQLAAAGPPAELDASLEDPPDPELTTAPIAFPLLPKRRYAVAALLTAAAIAVAFGAGFLIGHHHSARSVFRATRSVELHSVVPASNALAVVRLGAPDSAGNVPLELDVTGLAKQSARSQFYELWVKRGGSLVAACGTFRVHGATTSIRLGDALELRPTDGFAVTTRARRVVLTT